MRKHLKKVKLVVPDDSLTLALQQIKRYQVIAIFERLWVQQLQQESEMFRKNKIHFEMLPKWLKKKRNWWLGESESIARLFHFEVM